MGTYGEPVNNRKIFCVHLCAAVYGVVMEEKQQQPATVEEESAP